MERVLDFGCGTGILAILAEKMGAREVIAVDNDPWALENARENLRLNHCRKVRVVEAGLGFSGFFRTVLANINLNVLMDEMENIGRTMVKGGAALFSGFYLEDLGVLDAAASGAGLRRTREETLNRWTVGVYVKAD
jgi:ribosomal protein L11 methyltransferase